MQYQLQDAQQAWLDRLRPVAREAARTLWHWDGGLPLRPAAALLGLLEDAGTTHAKPDFGLAGPPRGGAPAVREEVVRTGPFGRLLRFAKDTPKPGPKLLVVAPLSGHFATRLRDTLAALLPDHDLHVTDWADARLVPPTAGRFGLDDQVALVMDWLAAIGPRAHLLAVSQPAVACLAATALLAEDDSPARPRSLTIIGGPVDPRIRPTRETLLARALPPAWFAAAEVAAVPPPFAGAGRLVRPGAQQFAASVLSDLPAHGAATLAQWRALAAGDAAAIAAHRRRYGALRAVMDVPAEHYLETIQRVFRAAELARGRMRWRGRQVRPEAIRDTPLLVVEGEADASCPPGQAAAALALCHALAPGLRHHHLQPGAGHGALFEGAAWQAEIRPLVRSVIRSG